MLKNVRNIYLY